MSSIRRVPELLDTLLTYTNDKNEQIPDDLREKLKTHPEDILDHLRDALLKYHDKDQKIEEKILAILVTSVAVKNPHIKPGYRGDDQEDGLGIMIYKYTIDQGVAPCIEVYVGTWKNKQRHGKGCMYSYNGDHYQGEWYEDQKCGKGCMKYKNGNKYIGFWMDDKKEREGFMQFNDMQKYCGRWKEDKMEVGTFTNEKQQWNFFGEFKGEYPSCGTLTYNSERTYSNQWQPKSVFDSKPTVVNTQKQSTSSDTYTTEIQKKQQDTILAKLSRMYYVFYDVLFDDGWGAHMEDMEMVGIIER
jgi:hypothetical protein